MRRAIAIRAAAALLAGVLALAVADNVRPWRHLQVEFLELEQRRLAAELAAAEARAEDGSAELQAELLAAEERLAAHADDVARLERELGGFEAKLDEAERRRQALRYRLEQARYRARRGLPTAGGGDIEEIEAEILETRAEIEGIREFVEDRRLRLQDLRSESLQAGERWQRLRAPLDDLEERLRQLDRGAWWRRLPVLGLFHPRVGVREVAPAALAGGRVDRCVTCHQGALRPGLEDETRPPVLRSHPRLDLFVGEASPHPYRRLGCTVCHGGEGRATDFERAGHPAAAAPWATRRIFPRGLFEAGCVRCHGDQGELPGAAVAAAGRRLIRQTGCGGCHRLPRAAAVDPAKPGPSLAGIAGKTRREWAFRWLAAPRAWRPSTFMPHFFDLEAGAGRERQIAEIRAIVTYLWESSGAAAFDQPPPGDADRGRALFASVGCGACHLDDAEAVRDGSYPTYERRHGPNLADTGDKVAAPWLYAWLRDPRAYRPDTPMPSLRLDEREAADLTAYLMTLRDPAWAAPEPPPMPAAARDALVLEHLRRTTTVERSHARLEGMTERERNHYLGERSIARYGCHGCHEIPGFEDAEPAAVDLTALGMVRVLRFLEGGHAGLDGAGRPGSAPRPLPDFGWSRREAEAVTVNLLGWQRLGTEESVAGLPQRPSLAAGRAVLDHLGCRHCHRIERRRTGDGSGDVFLGPDLSFEGAKVRASWLFTYLQDPGEVSLRPWQPARMPTFHWTDAQLDAVVRYFVDRDGVELFTRDPPPRQRPERERSLAVGAAAFRTLQCNRCHPGSEGGLPVPQYAPAYDLARQRLRPQWVVEWILDPRRWDPQTPMPASFVAASGDEPDASFLAASLATPLFRGDHERLLRVFDSEAELEAYLSDPRRVAAAMRDHLWSLGE